MNGRSPARTVLSLVWAVLPLVTLGLATPFVHAFAAMRLRSARLWAAAAGYLALLVVFIAGAQIAPVDSTGEPETSPVYIAAMLAWLAVWLGGTFHAFVLRNRLFFPPIARQTSLDLAIGAARHRDEVRERARALVRSDPVMARELRIGRPDLPRSFDDGGLIDVNGSPPQVLARLPGMTPRLVDQVVRTRDQVGGFSSVEEMSALASLPPDLTRYLAEYTVFLS